jgi:hypothetical protein
MANIKEGQDKNRATPLDTHNSLPQSLHRFRLRATGWIEDGQIKSQNQKYQKG